MEWQKTAIGFYLSAQNYQVRYNKTQKLIKIYSSNGEPYYGLSIVCSADKVEQTSPQLKINKDSSSGEPKINFEEQSDAMELRIEISSSLWNRKILVFKFNETFFTARLELEGEGHLDRIYFFRGCYEGNQLASLPWFREYICAQPNFLEKETYHASEYSGIQAGGDSSDWGPCLNSAPFIYGFGKEKMSKMLFAGLLAHKGENTFSTFEYNYQDQDIRSNHDSVVGTQAFSLAYYGQEPVREHWTSPEMMFFFEDNKNAGFRRYVNHLYNENIVGPCQIPDRSWLRPIFCGWHEQVAIALEKQLNNGTQQDKAFLEGSKESFKICTQERHEQWLSLLEKYDIPVGTLIIDATWQTAKGLNVVDTEKFPDLRGFIDRCHAKGIKVLLWLNAWDREGLPDELCLTNNGKPLAPDPTLPEYSELLREQIYRMTGSDSDCYNCDGFKLDATANLPFGYGIKTHGDIYGFELQRVYVELIYKTMKNVNPQAILSLFIANPYFADICDMVRTGDLYTTQASCRSSNQLRAELFNIAMPGKPVDTDGTFRFSYDEEHNELIKEQCHIGIPTLYQIEKIIHCRAFMPTYYTNLELKDYQNISKIMHNYMDINQLY